MPAASKGQPSVSGRQLDSRHVPGNQRRGNGGFAETRLLLLTVSFWPRVASATRDLPAGDPLLRSACQLRCLATPVVLRDAWMARHALGVLNQQRRDSVHEVFRNVVKHPGP